MTLWDRIFDEKIDDSATGLEILDEKCKIDSMYTLSIDYVYIDNTIEMITKQNIMGYFPFHKEFKKCQHLSA